MRKVEININGKAYPCRQTMGAMLRYREMTGKEVTEIEGALSDLCAYIYCCVVSACKRDSVEFDMSFMDFADSIAPEDLEKWTDDVSGVSDQKTADGETGDEKKS